MKQAIGMIETKGLIALIEATDTMLKASEVRCLGKKQVGGGLNTVLIAGDVAAVETAVQAGSASVERLGEDLLTASHVIARPHIEATTFVDEIQKVAESKPNEREEVVVETSDQIENTEIVETDQKKIVRYKLQQMKVTELRKLAKEQPNFSIPQKNIHRTNKEKLVKALSDILIIDE